VPHLLDERGRVAAQHILFGRRSALDEAEALVQLDDARL
jgi:hypothetical protein